MIEVSGATKTFNAGTPDERRALDGVDLALPAGAFAVVVGSNGAGKSTLIEAIAGGVSLDAGHVRIGGADVTRLPVHRRAAKIARVFQDPRAGSFPDMSVEENLLVAELRGRRAGLGHGVTGARRDRWRAALASLRLGLEDRLAARVGQLSGGQRQSLALVMATLAAPAALLLDEHTAALDPRTARLVMEATVAMQARTGVTTVMVTHNMQHAIAWGDHLVMMHEGRIRRAFAGEAKTGLTVEALVASFETADDKLLLAR